MICSASSFSPSGIGCLAWFAPPQIIALEVVLFKREQVSWAATLSPYRAKSGILLQPRGDCSFDRRDYRMPPIDEAAWGGLLPRIEALARRVARKLNMSPLTRDEFISGAASWISLQHEHYDSAKGDLGGWCFRVLYNHGVTHIRKGARHGQAIARWRNDVGITKTQMFRADQSLPDSDSTPQADAADLLERHVAGENRIILAIDCGMLAGTDAARVSRWLTEAQLPPDFPWREIEAVEKQAARRLALSAAFGQNEAWLRQRIRRTLQKLRDAMGVAE